MKAKTVTSMFGVSKAYNRLKPTSTELENKFKKLEAEDKILKNSVKKKHNKTLKSTILAKAIHQAGKKEGKKLQIRKN
jgi:predicted subunit of tRNA(5-methylaminomethyl-2-thiouridylate) methyltransferase